MNVYVIVYEGPEWSNAIEAHESEKKAKGRCKELNRELTEKKDKTVYESLSVYRLKEIPLIK